jgi:hypothetical protein
MAQTPPPPPFTAFIDPFAAIVDQWFDVVETLLSAQREWVKASLDSPLPPYPIFPPMAQTANERRVPSSVLPQRNDGAPGGSPPLGGVVRCDLR